MPTDAEPAIKVLGRYAICGNIGAGGMATVHVGRLLGPVGFSRTVAIKRMHAHLARDAEFVTMFLEEARLAARVQHANVVATLDVVTEGPELFHVMEYVEGESLAKLFASLSRAGSRLPIPVIGTIVSQALHGLHAVHETRGDDGRSLGLIHRDVSPDNLLVGRDGTTRILDFGIAKATEHGRRTLQGQIKGKVAYMSPEQLRAQDLDRRSDIYATSAVLWEALTGRRLIEGNTDVEMVHNALSKPPKPPSALVPTLSRQVDAIVMKGLARNPAERYATAREMAVAIEKFLGIASPATVAELVETAIGTDLAKKAAVVDSAVKRIAEATKAGFTNAESILAASTPASARSARALAPTAVGDTPFKARSAETLQQGSEHAGGIERRSSRPPGGTDVLPFPDLLGEGGARPPSMRPASPASFGDAGAGLELDLPKLPSLGDAPAPRPAAAAGVEAPGPALDGPKRLRPPSERPLPPTSAVSSGLSLAVELAPPSKPPSGPHAPVSTPPSSGRAMSPSGSFHGSAPPLPPVYGYGGPGFGRPGPAPSKAGTSTLLVPIVLGVLIIAAVALVLVFRSSPQATSASAAAPPPTREETSACDILRQRARVGGATTGLSRSGWAVELWLRGEGGKKIDTASLDASSLSIQTGSDIIEVKPLTAPGKTLDEGVVVRLRGATPEGAFEEAGALKLIKAADALFERTRADAGALYMKCAHLPHNDIGLWFRGKDLRSASASLVFTMAMFSENKVLKEAALEKDIPANMPYYERLHGKLYGPRTKDLATEIERYGATLDEPAPGSVRITFPVTRLGDAVRASRVVADKAGVENL